MSYKSKKIVFPQQKSYYSNKNEIKKKEIYIVILFQIIQIEKIYIANKTETKL